jgi:rubrerythrin
MTRLKTALIDNKMLTLLKRWTELEAATIKSCGAITKKTKNPLVKTLITSIASDSEKHKSILKLIIDSMTKKAFVLTPDEVSQITALLDKHIDLENEAIAIAEQAVKISKDPVTRQLLRLILEDEKKHASLTEQINELKFRTLASIT